MAPLALPKQSSVIKYLHYLPYLKGLAQTAEAIHGASTGPQKKAAVLGAFAWLVEGAEPLVLAKNPALAVFAPVLDAVVEELKQTSQMPAPAVPLLGTLIPLAAAPATAAAAP